MTREALSIIHNFLTRIDRRLDFWIQKFSRGGI